MLANIWSLYQLAIVGVAALIAYVAETDLKVFVLIHGIALLTGSIIYIFVLHHFLAQHDSAKSQ